MSQIIGWIYFMVPPGALSTISVFRVPANVHVGRHLWDMLMTVLLL